MTKLYLDIDGVLVTTKNTHAAEGVIPFLKFITEHFDCYWLTTHCKGDALPAVEYVKEYIPNCESYLSKIKPTQWNTLKTEAIDFSSDFYWLDDYPMTAEKQVLAQYDRTSNLIVVNLKRPNELDDIIQILMRKHGRY